MENIKLWRIVILVTSLSNIWGQSHGDAIFGKSKFQNPGSIASSSADLETGFEFLSTNLQLNVDEEFFFGSSADAEALRRRSQFNFTDLVRMFVWNVKDLNYEKAFDLQKIPKTGYEYDYEPDITYKPHLFRELVKLDLRLYEVLRRFYEKHARNPDTPTPLLDSYLIDIEKTSLRAINLLNARVPSGHYEQDVYLYMASHPLLVYKLVRRFSDDLRPLLWFVYHRDKDIFQELQWLISGLWTLPSSEDLQTTWISLSRMQMDNDLDTYNLARGILGKVDTGIALNAINMLEIGSFHLQENRFDYAILWINLAKETVQKSSIGKAHPKILEFFQGCLETAVDLHNTNLPNLFSNRWVPFVFHAPVKLPFKPAFYTRRLQQLNHVASQKRNNSVWNWAIRVNYRRLCAGENLQSETEKAQLYCWYNKPHSFWLIGPLKTELLNQEPRLVQIYDFIPESVLNNLERTAIVRLRRSYVINPNESLSEHGKTSKDRTSIQAWIYEQENQGTFLQDFTSKLELLTGLKVRGQSRGDAYQVAVYAAAQFYDTHIDSLQYMSDSGENRITTIMGYLSEPKEGGRTAFPVFGTFTEPVSRSIVIWNSLKRNGAYRDERTWHGGCPVILGVKWIVNKWVSYGRNFQTYRCSLNPIE